MGRNKVVGKKERYRGWTIRFRPSRKKCWQVCYPKRDGVRQFRHFDTLSAARGHIDKKVAELVQIGQQAFDLSDAQRQDAVEAQKILGSVRLVDAAAFWQKHHTPTGGRRKFNELLVEYIEQKRKAGLRKHTINDARRRCGHFAHDFGEQYVHEITVADVSDFLDRWSGISRLNYRTALVAFFNFAIRRGLRLDNPAEAVARPVIDQSMPEVFTVAEVERLLLFTQARYPRLIPALTIGLFAGLRQNEIDLTDWSAVDLQGRSIRVLPAVAKRRRTRVVDMSDNLLTWLLPYKGAVGPIGVPYSVYRRQIKEILKDAKIGRWPRNGLRHTYATAHFAMHEDAAKTAKELGHLSSALLYDCYRNLMSKEDATKFWGIKPTPASALPAITKRNPGKPRKITSTEENDLAQDAPLDGTGPSNS